MWLGQLEQHWAVVWQDVQQVKVPAAKPEDLSSIPWIHIVDSADCPLASTYAPWSVYTCLGRHTHLPTQDHGQITQPLYFPRNDRTTGHYTQARLVCTWRCV